MFWLKSESQVKSRSYVCSYVVKGPPFVNLNLQRSLKLPPWNCHPVHPNCPLPLRGSPVTFTRQQWGLDFSVSHPHHRVLGSLLSRTISLEDIQLHYLPTSVTTSCNGSLVPFIPSSWGRRKKGPGVRRRSRTVTGLGRSQVLYSVRVIPLTPVSRSLPSRLNWVPPYLPPLSLSGSVRPWRHTTLPTSRSPGPETVSDRDSILYFLLEKLRVIGIDISPPKRTCQTIQRQSGIHHKTSVQQNTLNMSLNNSSTTVEVLLPDPSRGLQGWWRITRYVGGVSVNPNVWYRVPKIHPILVTFWRTHL